MASLRAPNVQLQPVSVTRKMAAALPGRMIASAQGLSSGALGGALQAALLFAAGAVAAGWGTAMSYWVAVAAAGLAMVFAVLLARVWDGGRIAE